MADLTACYFCGDSTVDEYPVIPPRMDPPDDTQRTVALCPDCHERLGAVLRTVVDFLGDRDATAGGGGARSGGSGALAGDGSATSGGAGGDTPAADDEDVWFESPGAGEGGAPADVSRTSATGGSDPDSGTRESGGTSASGRTGASGDEAAPGGGGTGGGAPATAPESYRKVLRLLQNREFPVDRAEFETVAANAYELSPGEVGAALDAAVDRGLIDDEAGTLHRSK